MSFLDDARAAATMPVPGPNTPDDMQRMLDALPIGELAEQWRALQSIGLREQTEKSWSVSLYFNRLPHESPQRAFALIREVLRVEPDKAVLIELADDVLCKLISRHAGLLIDVIEATAVNDAGMRWLLGGVHHWAGDDGVRTRLARLADESGWRADERRHDRRTPSIDFAALTTAELARVWIEQKTKANKDRDRNWFALMDFERDLVEDAPDVVIDLVLAILAVETHPAVLSLLAAGPLEEVIGLGTIDRIEREAASNERFRDLLGGVWYWNETSELKARLDSIVGDRRW